MPPLSWTSETHLCFIQSYRVTHKSVNEIKPIRKLAMVPTSCLGQRYTCSNEECSQGISKSRKQRARAHSVMLIPNGLFTFACAFGLSSFLSMIRIIGLSNRSEVGSHYSACGGYPAGRPDAEKLESLGERHAVSPGCACVRACVRPWLTVVVCEKAGILGCRDVIAIGIALIVE